MYEWIPVAPVVPESKEAKINGVTSESRHVGPPWPTMGHLEHRQE